MNREQRHVSTLAHLGVFIMPHLLCMSSYARVYTNVNMHRGIFYISTCTGLYIQVTHTDTQPPLFVLPASGLDLGERGFFKNLFFFKRTCPIKSMWLLQVKFLTCSSVTMTGPICIGAVYTTIKSSWDSWLAQRRFPFSICQSPWKIVLLFTAILRCA